jgi:hypothetical protein
VGEKNRRWRKCRKIALSILSLHRAGHGSVRAGFCPFGYPTRASQVGEFPTRDSDEKMENRRVSGGSIRVFLVGLIGSVQVFLDRD